MYYYSIFTESARMNSPYWYPGGSVFSSQWLLCWIVRLQRISCGSVIEQSLFPNCGWRRVFSAVNPGFVAPLRCTPVKSYLAVDSVRRCSRVIHGSTCLSQRWLGSARSLPPNGMVSHSGNWNHLASDSINTLSNLCAPFCIPSDIDWS